MTPPSERFPDKSDPAVQVTAAASTLDATSQGATVSDVAGGPIRGLAPGRLLGRYVVIERIGAGGMGVVYAASDPELGRKVALKLMRPDRRDSRGLLDDRLLREAQSMARLAHPNVVSVHDVGWFGDQVFVAMELVEGQTLTRWLAAEQRSWREVVAVFLAAGRGLAAAHAAGILHRDFKPDNVLVGRDGRVRVMDFGLARSAGPHPAAPGAAGWGPGADRLGLSLTRTGDVLGTPCYMAPEQLLGDPTEPRSDQFSFCVALWEALYRQRPFEGDSLESLAGAVLQGKLREPPRGARIPARLRRTVARGLAVSPGARHPDMADLLARLAGFARRRRGAGIAAAAALASLAAGALVWRGLPGPSRLCTGADEIAASAWDPARRAAGERAFAATGLPYAAGAWTRVAGILDRYRDGWVAMHTDACKATRVDEKQSEELLGLRMNCLDERRKELAALVSVLSSADAGTVEKSVSLAYGLTGLTACADTAALTAMERPPTDAETTRQVDHLRTRIAEARALMAAGKVSTGLEQARAIAGAAAAIGYRPVEAEAFYLLGQLEASAGEQDDAEKSLLRAVQAAEAGRHDRFAASALVSLVFLVGYEKAEYARGMELSRHAAAFLERVGGDPMIEGVLEKALGAVEGQQGRLDEAVRHFERAGTLLEKYEGPDGPMTLTALDNLAVTLNMQGHIERALAIHRRLLEQRERLFGQEHPSVADSLENLGHDVAVLGRHEEAEGLYRKALAVREKAFGPDHPKVGFALSNVAEQVAVLGRREEALEMHRRALAIAEKAWGPDHPVTATQLMNTGIALKKLGRLDEALAHHRRAEAVAAKALGPDHPQVAEIWMAMADALFAKGRAREALELYRRALPILQKAFGPTHRKPAAALTLIGQTLLNLDGPAAALPVLEELSALPTDSVAPRDLGARRFLLAVALWDSRRDRPRARQLAAAARADFARAGTGYEDELALIDRWLSRHRQRSGVRRPAGPSPR